jgi:hypothetical protein
MVMMGWLVTGFSDITVFPLTATSSTALRLLKSVQDSRHWHHYSRNKGTNITPRSLKLAHEGCVRMCVFMSQGVGGFSKCSHHPKYLLAGKTSRAFFTRQTCVQDTKTFVQFLVNSTFLTSKLSRTDLIGHILWLCSRTE